MGSRCTRHVVTALCVLAALVIMSCTQAGTMGTTAVNSRTALHATDFLDWGTTGAVGALLPNPFNVESDMGSWAHVSQMNSANFQLRQQSNPVSSKNWNGNFAPNDTVLWTHFSNGPITITFDTLMMAAGAQIQPNTVGAFDGKIQAFDDWGGSLGAFSFHGMSNQHADNSAVFMGLQSSSANIRKLVFSVNGQWGADFAIDRVDLRECAPVPEPASLLTLLAGAGGLIGLVRRRLR